MVSEQCPNSAVSDKFCVLGSLKLPLEHWLDYPPFFNGCGFLLTIGKLPSYSGAFWLTIDNLSFFTYNWSFFAYSFSFFSYNWSFFAYSGKVSLISALRDCKQRSSTVSKKTPPPSERGCRTSSCLLESVAVQGGVAATLSPVALQRANLAH